MSDYISKQETIKALRNYAEQKHCGGETVLANGILKAVCFVEREENIPTVDEKEIIRKAFERAVERLENIEPTPWEIVKIVKEECGV